MHEPAATVVQSWDPGPAPALPSRGRRPAFWQRATSRLSTVLLAVLGGFMVLVAGLLLAGIKPRVEATGSMEPVLSPGDLVFIREIPAYEARVGDVVAFQEPTGRQRVIVHRVTRVERVPGERLAFTTKGDANRTAETWQIRTDGRMGIMSFSVPYAGRALAPFRGIPWGVVPLLTALALGGLALRRIWSAG